MNGLTIARAMSSLAGGLTRWVVVVDDMGSASAGTDRVEVGRRRAVMTSSVGRQAD